MTTTPSNKGRTEQAPQQPPMAIMVAAMAGALIWMSMAGFLPDDMRASRISLGLLSKVDFAGWIALTIGSAVVIRASDFLGRALGGVGIVLGVLILAYSYKGALNLAAEQGPDTLARNVIAEIGCFPTSFEAIATERGFTLPAEEKMCGYEAPAN